LNLIFPPVRSPTPVLISETEGAHLVPLPLSDLTLSALIARRCIPWNVDSSCQTAACSERKVFLLGCSPLPNFVWSSSCLCPRHPAKQRAPLVLPSFSISFFVLRDCETWQLSFPGAFFPFVGPRFFHSCPMTKHLARDPVKPLLQMRAVRQFCVTTSFPPLFSIKGLFSSLSPSR